MIESINPVGVEAAQSTTSSAVADPKASAQDVRDFSASMDRTSASAQAQPVEGVQANAVEATPQSSEGLKTLLGAFDKLNGGAESIREAATKLGGGNDFSPSQVIEMTMQCQQFMFQTQLTSNVANRTSDGIQQLFRQQS